MIKLTEMELDKNGDLELIYEDDSNGHFLMGGTFSPNTIRVTIPKSKFSKLKKLLGGKNDKSR